MLSYLRHTMRLGGLLLLVWACAVPGLYAQEATDFDEPGAGPAFHLAAPLQDDAPATHEAAIDQDVPGQPRASASLLDLGVRPGQDVSDQDGDQPFAAALPWAALVVLEDELDTGRGDVLPLPRLGLAATPSLSFDELDNGRSDVASLPRLGLAAAAPLSVDELDNGRDAAAKAARRSVFEATVQEELAATVEISEAELPEKLSLGTNYPNPFNPTTAINFTVHEQGHATLKIFDVVGREVATLFDGVAQPGLPYQVTFEASELASGLYLYRLTAGNLTVQKKMLLAK